MIASRRDIRAYTTHALVGDSYYGPHLKDNVEAYVKTCLMCQQDEIDHRGPVGLLEPLPIPERPC